MFPWREVARSAVTIEVSWAQAGWICHAHPREKEQTHLVPHARYQHETRIRTRLRRPSKRPQRRQAREVMRRSLDHQEDTPEHDVEPKILAYRQPLHQEIRGKRPSQEPEVKDRTQPAVLRSLQVQVLADSEDGGVRQGGLVDVEEGVADC